MTNATESSSSPSIAIDTNNNVHVLWSDYRDGNLEIYYKKFDNNGDALTGDIRVTNTTGHSHSPTIAVDTNNNVHISWHDDRDGNFEINYKKYDNNGNALTGDIRVTNTAYPYGRPSIAIDTNNNVHISWTDKRDGNGEEIYYKKYDNNGNALTGDIRVTNSTWYSHFPSIAVDTNNNVYISYVYISGEVFGYRKKNYIYYKKLYPCSSIDLFFKNIHLFLFVLLVCFVCLIISKTLKWRERRRWEEARRREEEQRRQQEEARRRREEEQRRREEEARKREEERRRRKEEQRRREEETRRKKDYYKILGVSKNATQGEIKKKYRELAKQYHPDLNNKKQKEEANEKMKEINEAYEILKDPEKKRKYDEEMGF